MNPTKIAKHLTYLLRHCQDPLYIDLNGGWAKVTDIQTELGITRAELEQIIQEDDKGRISFDPTGNYIRANQGHSIPGVVVDMIAAEPPEFLYHGTATRFLDSIMKEGLKPMSRQWVHISSDYETAAKVGARHGKPVVICIRAREFWIEGNELYLSSNGVWQAKHVPVEYIDNFGDVLR